MIQLQSSVRCTEDSMRPNPSEGLPRWRGGGWAGQGRWLCAAAHMEHIAGRGLQPMGKRCGVKTHTPLSEYQEAQLAAHALV